MNWDFSLAHLAEDEWLAVEPYEGPDERGVCPFLIFCALTPGSPAAPSSPPARGGQSDQ
jgi:hypothetical protein